MGTGHLRRLIDRSEEDNIKVLAVCDVYKRRLTRARGICGGDGYMDYRHLVERKDIDAVLIATPDHWHAKIAIDAMEAGKHVYCEKPMTHTVEQALAVRNAVRSHKKLLQVGPQGTSDPQYRTALDMIKSGRVGKVTWAQASSNRNIKGCAFNVWFPIDPTAGPDRTGEDYIDWKMWLGSEYGFAPDIPWNPEHFFRFRKYWPYNGGVATDLIYHRLAPLLIAMAGPNGQYPLRANANGGLYLLKDGRDIPDVFIMTLDYPDEFSINLVSVLTNDDQVPTKIYGNYATIELDRGPVITGNGDFEDEFKARNGGYLQITPSVERGGRDMQGNLIDAIRGKAELFCNVELGCATMVGVKMAVESYRQRKTMLWDATNERVVS